MQTVEHSLAKTYSPQFISLVTHIPLSLHPSGSSLPLFLPSSHFLSLPPSYGPCLPSSLPSTRCSYLSSVNLSSLLPSILQPHYSMFPLFISIVEPSFSPTVSPSLLPPSLPFHLSSHPSTPYPSSLAPTTLSLGWIKNFIKGDKLAFCSDGRRLLLTDTELSQECQVFWSWVNIRFGCLYCKWRTDVVHSVVCSSSGCYKWHIDVFYLSLLTHT